MPSSDPDPHPPTGDGDDRTQRMPPGTDTASDPTRQLRPGAADPTHPVPTLPAGTVDATHQLPHPAGANEPTHRLQAPGGATRGPGSASPEHAEDTAALPHQAPRTTPQPSSPAPQPYSPAQQPHPPTAPPHPQAPHPYPQAPPPGTGPGDRPARYPPPVPAPPPPAQGYPTSGAPVPYPSQQPYPPPHPQPPAVPQSHAAQVPGVDPVSGQPWSDRSRTAAGLLQLLPGLIGLGGIGRLYTGHIGMGVAHIILSVVGWICAACLWMLVLPLLVFLAAGAWAIVDGIVILAGRATDAQGRPLRY